MKLFLLNNDTVWSHLEQTNFPFFNIFTSSLSWSLLPSPRSLSRIYLVGEKPRLCSELGLAGDEVEWLDSRSL